MNPLELATEKFGETAARAAVYMLDCPYLETLANYGLGVCFPHLHKTPDGGLVAMKDLNWEVGLNNGHPTPLQSIPQGGGVRVIVDGAWCTVETVPSEQETLVSPDDFELIVSEISQFGLAIFPTHGDFYQYEQLKDETVNIGGVEFHCVQTWTLEEPANLAPIDESGLLSSLEKGKIPVVWWKGKNGENLMAQCHESQMLSHRTTKC